jgi:hypothetical protein
VNDFEALVRGQLHDLADDLPAGDGTANADVARGRYRRQRRNRLTVAALCAGLLVVAGGSVTVGSLLSAGPPAGSVLTPAEESVPTAPTPAPATETTTPPPAPLPTVEPPPAAPTSATPAAAEDEDWPAEAAAVEGDTYWAVFLDVVRDDAESDNGRLKAAMDSLAELGYYGGVEPVGCDVGAQSTLGLDPDATYYGVSVFFETAAEAQRFVDLYQPGLVGTAQISYGCGPHLAN